MQDLEQWLRIALWLLGSAVLPSLVYLVVRRGWRPPGHRIAVWSCLWAGQLVVPLVLAAWLSLVLGGEMHRLGSLPAALVFGGGGALVAALLTARAVEVLRIGVSILQAGADATVGRRCGRVAERVLVGPLGVAVLLGLMMVIPIPGRFGGLVYLVLVLGPIAVASIIMLLVVFGARWLVRP